MYGMLHQKLILSCLLEQRMNSNSFHIQQYYHYNRVNPNGLQGMILSKILTYQGKNNSANILFFLVTCNKNKGDWRLERQVW